MSIKLFDLSMKEIQMRGVKWLELIPDPPQVERITESVWDGEITLGKRRLSRKLSARFFYLADGRSDYKVLRNEIFSLLDPIQTFYVIDTDLPERKWKVDIDTQSLTRLNAVAGEWAVEFVSAQTYAYSVFNTLNDELYKSTTLLMSAGLNGNASKADYKRTTSTFTIYNAGDGRVEPENYPLKITIKLTGSSVIASDIRLINSSTGEEWRYRGTFQTGDTITIDGVKAERNGVNIVGATGPEFGLISLAPGINNFTVTGLSGSFEITFDFPFLYL
ncbi:phage tail family protein [Planomicrobium chinense]|uniref:phage tail domain-containing protein n=1 Tax=Planococcus chinensis TaxID=272917 RepID=UPI001CC75848|nr:phage tail domain-containing protein [Planococcus chinensis]MBZ5203193.1 phage tail family protein [Planococcus chinensis]